MAYKHNKAWRKRNPEKRYAGKKNYYQRSVGKENSGQLWTVGEIEAVIAPDRPFDSVLSNILQRSVNSIQKMRYRIKS